MTAQIQQALALIQPGMTVSLGGGRHMQWLAEAIAHSTLTDLQLCSPSALTLADCRQLQLPICEQPVKIDLAFDGCDSVDQQFNLLKSNGGIHTDEHLFAQLAEQYVILTETAKVTPRLNPQVPLTVEVLPAAAPALLAHAAHLGLTAQVRVAANYQGYVYTRAGNVLVDCQAMNWDNLAGLNAMLLQYTGVVATSYFPQAATMVLAETDNGEVQVLRKEGSHDL